MKGTKGEHRYAECGLTSVLLTGIMVYRCTNCSAVVPEIPEAGVLHRVIALRLIRKKSQLNGPEFRYLRKFCGYSVNDLAEILGSSKSVISRWEKEGCGKQLDRTIRLLTIAKLTRELVGQPEPILKNIRVEELMAEAEQSLKDIVGRAHANEQYIISPEEMAKFSGRAEPAELVGSSVN